MAKHSERNRTNGPQSTAEGSHPDRMHAGTQPGPQDHAEGEYGAKNSERGRLYDEHARGRDGGPSDNRGNLHGLLGHKGHRADYKTRGPDGLRAKE